MKRLQLPKDKFPRLAINIAFIIIWLNLGSFFQVEIFLLKLTDTIFFFLGGIVDKFGVTLYYGQTFYKFIDLIIVLIPIILVTWYIWNGKISFKTKITRSKD